MNEARERNQGSKKTANLVTYIPGHETEYVLTVHKDPFSEAEQLPLDWEREIQDKLGERWSVLDRGGRIEIIPPHLAINEANSEKVMSTLEDVLGNKHDLRLMSFSKLRRK